MRNFVLSSACFSPWQRHSEGRQSSAASGQLQSPQHEVPQRQAAGQTGAAGGSSPPPGGSDSTGGRTLAHCLLFTPLWKEVEARGDLSYPNFTQLYRTLMFDAQKSVSGAFHSISDVVHQSIASELAQSFVLFWSFTSSCQNEAVFTRYSKFPVLTGTPSTATVLVPLVKVTGSNTHWLSVTRMNCDVFWFDWCRSSH